VSAYLHEAETPEDFRYRKGYIDGHLRTVNLTENLISLSEVGDAEWAQQELEKLMKAARGLTLVPEKKGQQEQEQEERLSRVLRAAQVSTRTNSIRP
jgi:hypothetical protein